MSRPAALLLLAAMAASPADAESIYIDTDPHDWIASSSTEYETVDGTERILLARAVATVGDEVRFKIEESFKGDAGEARFLSTASDAAKGSLHVFFMNLRDDEWTLSDLGLVEVEAENRDWVRVMRLFGRISALDDEAGEKKALRELREAALADPRRYPEGLVRMIDLHFGTPTPGKPFSDLVDLYDAAATDGERLAVLWALNSSDHPEVATFFRSLLLGGEPLWLMQPVLDWMSAGSGDDVPLLKELARVWLGHAGEDRTGLLDLMIENAVPEDDLLLWSLLPAADMAEKEVLVDHVLGRKEPNPFTDGLRLPPDDPVTADLFVLYMGRSADSEAQFRLESLLRKNETRDWRSVASLEELVSTWEASRKPVERREILLEAVRRLDEKAVGEDEAFAVLWRLVRQAPPREAEALLHVVYSLLGDEEKLAALYRAASGEEEKNRALWFLLAAQGPNELEPLLSAVGALGQGSVRLERVARAFLTCPSEEVRLNLAEHLDEELALPGDFLTMLKVLEGASLAEARRLAPWFARNPGPEALSFLWRLPIPSLHLDPELAEALAASGDPEVLDMALDLRQRVAAEVYRWPYRVIARSPLPAALEEARAILEEGGFAQYQLMRELGEGGIIANPWHEQFLQEIADSETVDEVFRKKALTWLAEFFSSGASPEP
ncbi:MAG TPA: hypothetical protein VF179_08525 [Thermoanaerobaculia bacterium]|nr:hypothetical protein [Thermoanaerobaculia bacterium]